MVSYSCSPGLNSAATEVRTSLAENGSKSLKGGRTVREGASMSGTAAADLERDGGGFLRGLEREMRSLSVVGILARHRLFRKCAVGVLYPVAGGIGQ